MLLGRVVGTVVMTIKHPAYQGQKLMAVDLLDEKGAPNGKSLLAIDRAQAGTGDHVLIMREGNGVRQIFGRDLGVPVEDAIKAELPVRSIIVGIVDEVDAS